MGCPKLTAPVNWRTREQRMVTQFDGRYWILPQRQLHQGRFPWGHLVLPSFLNAFIVCSPIITRYSNAALSSTNAASHSPETAQQSYSARSNSYKFTSNLWPTAVPQLSRDMCGHVYLWNVLNVYGVINMKSDDNFPNDRPSINDIHMLWFSSNVIIHL